MSETYRKKLIEVALPLASINDASAREKAVRNGHPSSLHLWWARRPLAAARAVIFAQMVDDPSADPGRFPTEKAQEAERERLFSLLEQLVLWENTGNQQVLGAAKAEIASSWRRTCERAAAEGDEADLFDPAILPAFHDPFSGGGALPLEAQRLGLESYASDLNPVAVLISKGMVEIPARFAGRGAVNPTAAGEGQAQGNRGVGALGIADDLRYYGEWVLGEAGRRIGHLYPKAEVGQETVDGRPDLEQYVGESLPVIAWIWVRTVKSPNPAFASVDVPLATSFMVSTKSGKEAYVEPIVGQAGYEFRVRTGAPLDPAAAKRGTKLGRGANFACVMSGTPISADYIKAEAQAGRMGARLMAVVAAGSRGRVYLSPSEALAAPAVQASAEWRPDVTISGTTQYLGAKLYGMEQFADLFTERQLVALTTFSDLIGEARDRVLGDARSAGWDDDGTSLEEGGDGASAYADALAIYLSFILNKQADLANSLCRWEPVAQCPRQLFGRQAIPMAWDYAEGNPLGSSSGAWSVLLNGVVKAFAKSFDSVRHVPAGHAEQADARKQVISVNKIVSTDPPYYDNVPYADLADFFYVWSRRTLSRYLPRLFSTLTVPKTDELVAFAYRHGGREGADAFFLDGMTDSIRQLAKGAHPAFPVTIFYAFKQAEASAVDGSQRTGWETFLDAIMRAGLSITGTWPIRTENESRLRGQSANALASSIVLVCRPRPVGQQPTTRRDFAAALKAELPDALKHLQRGNIAPVDLAQASIGPGMAVFTRYSDVVDAEGNPLSVRDALSIINQTLDEVLAEQEGDFDADTRWALSWFEQYGFAEGDYGAAETLSKAKNTSVDGLVEAGVVAARAGKVRLLRPDELPAEWEPNADVRLTVWEGVHHLIRALDEGEEVAAQLVARLGASQSETARELAYRLFTVSERKRRPTEALSYNALVQSWPELVRISAQYEGVGEQQSMGV